MNSFISDRDPVRILKPWVPNFIITITMYSVGAEYQYFFVHSWNFQNSMGAKAPIAPVLTGYLHVEFIFDPGNRGMSRQSKNKEFSLSAPHGDIIVLLRGAGVHISGFDSVVGAHWRFCDERSQSTMTR